MKKIKLWWKFEGRYYHKDFIRGVKNLIKFFPIVWKDRSWDFSYIYKMLEFKLKNTRDYIQKRQRFVGWEYVVRDLNICINLLDKVEKGYYETEYFEHYDSNLEFVPTDETEKLFTVKLTTERDDLDVYFNKYPRLYEKYKNKENRNSIAIHMGMDMHEKAKRLLFKIIQEKINNWWD